LEIELLKEINDLDNLNKGELSLGGSQYILSHILLPVFSKFQKNYPRIKLNIIECSSELLNSNLLNGKIDLCLKCEDIKSPFSNQGFAFKDNLILAVPKIYIKNFNLPENYFFKEDILNSSYHSFKNLPLEFIEKIPLIILSKGNNLHDRVEMIANEYNLKLNITLEVSQLVTAFHLATVGLGATFTTNLLIEKTFNDNLVYYKIDSPLSIRKFNFVTREKGYIPKAVLKFIEIGRETLN
ncbi:LysR family transcriptional regulator substrate-binding protein, partial [Fusobacterium nucleatum]